MKIIIKTTNLESTPFLRELIENKINPLEKFSKILQNSKKDKRKPPVEVWVEVGRTTLHHRKGNVFLAECQMRFSGRSLRATAQAENLRMALDEVKKEIKKEIKKYKEKPIAQDDRIARRLKNDIHFSPQD